MTCPKTPEIFTLDEKLWWSVLGDGTVSIVKFVGDDENVVIPSEIDGKKVTRIGEQAFLDCSSLTSINIPESVKNIYHSAFRDCTSLASINLPDGVKIGKNTFYGTPLEYKYK